MPACIDLADIGPGDCGPCDVLSGMAGYSDAIGFYAAPSARIMRSFRAPADVETASRRLAASGGMVVCESRQSDCMASLSALRYTNALRRELSLRPGLLWLEGPELQFTILLIPPPPVPAITRR